MKYPSMAVFLGEVAQKTNKITPEDINNFHPKKNEVRVIKSQMKTILNFDYYEDVNVIPKATDIIASIVHNNCNLNKTKN